MESKVCSKCGVIKPLTEYHKNGKQGLRPDCKACKEKVHRVWAVSAAGKASLKAAMDRYRKTEHGLKKIAENAARPEVKKAKRDRIRAWSKSPEQRAKHAERARKYRSDGAGKYKDGFRAKVSRATSRGVIPRAAELSCRYCGQQAAEYHHPSYDPEHWLTIVPVCVPCHWALHS